MNLAETLKYALYRTPVVRRAMAPRFPYKITPGQLAALINLIDETAESGSAVVEIGVARGDTSAFLLEHLRVSGADRPVLFVDTFSGFTPESIDVEVEGRGKQRSAYDAFRYGDAGRFTQDLNRLGHERFTVLAGDAAAVDWSEHAPIGAVLLDIDLYQPTLAVLRNIWPHIEAGGGVIVDDCLEDTPWDGSLEAVRRFSEEAGVEPVRVGGKGLLLRRTAARAGANA